MQCPTNASARPLTILENTTISSWTSDTSQAGYSYHADITNDEITEDMSATVIFNNAQASSGNYAPFCITGDGYVRIFSKVNTTITIPTIRVAGTLNYYSLTGTVGNDLKPVKIVSGKAIAVANDLVSTTADQIIIGDKRFRGIYYPSSEPSNGATSVPMRLQMYGGVAGKTNYANVTWFNRNDQTIGFGGPIQSGSDNSNGHNGYRIGLRDRADTNWVHFLHMWDDGNLTWTGKVTATNGFAGNVAGNSTTATTSSWANNLWTTSHNGSWYFESNWDGSYFQTQCRDSGSGRLPINVARANSAPTNGWDTIWGWGGATSTFSMGRSVSGAKEIMVAAGSTSTWTGWSYGVGAGDSVDMFLSTDDGTSTSYCIRVQVSGSTVTISNNWHSKVGAILVRW